MLYLIIKPLVNIFYRVFYKIEFKGLEKIPFGKPIILSPNHVNGFIDPGVVVMTLPRKVRMIARGDVFKNRLAKWALNSMNVSPMYRLQEGFGEVKKNDKTFEECLTLMSENKVLLLFPEAICVQEKRLRPLKKGLSRIIFQTEEAFDFKKEVYVVPIGLNYSAPKKFRSRLFVNFGTPLSIEKYEAQYKQDKARAVNDFTKALEQEMSQLIIIIKNKDNDELTAGINEIYLEQSLTERKIDCKNIEQQYHAGKEIADMINYHDAANPVLIDSLKDKIISYLRKLQNLDLRDHLFHPEKINKLSIGNFILDFIIIWFGMPFYIIGLLMNFPPYYLGRIYADKKIKLDEFYASMRVNVSMVLWIIYFGLQLIAGFFIFHSWIFLCIYALLIPLTGFYVLHYYPAMKKIFGRWRLLGLVRKDKEKIESLMKERMQIIAEIESAKKK